MEENQIRHNFATNLVKLRNSRGWNQTDLGNAVNYSFKNVSKWENEETLPSVEVLKAIADTFDVTIDDLISDKDIVRISHRKQNHLIITFISSLLPYVIGLIIFLVLLLCNLPNAYYCFLGAAIVSSITLITLASVWYKKWAIFSGVTYLIWSLSLLVIFLLSFEYFWIVLIIAAGSTLLTFGLFRINFFHHKK